MAYTTDGKLGVNLSARTTDPEFGLGTTTFDNEGKRWLYVKAGGAVTAAARVNVPAATFVAVANGTGAYAAVEAFVSGEHGWVHINDTDLV